MCARNVKVLVIGPFGAGKTTLIKTVCPNAVLTERPLKVPLGSKKTFTVALDYGVVEMNGTKVHLFGAPGQERFSFMLDVLARGVDALIVLLHGSEGGKYIEFAKKLGKPYIVALTGPSSDSPRSLRLNICDRKEILKVLGELLSRVQRG